MITNIADIESMRVAFDKAIQSTERCETDIAFVGSTEKLQEQIKHPSRLTCQVLGWIRGTEISRGFDAKAVVEKGFVVIVKA